MDSSSKDIKSNLPNTRLTTTFKVLEVLIMFTPSIVRVDVRVHCFAENYLSTLKLNIASKLPLNDLSLGIPLCE